MKSMVLEFLERPVDAEINKDGGLFDAPRHYGSHIGLDFLAYLKKVYAVEDGRVVYSGLRAGSEEKTNYGNTVVIDHTPGAGDNRRHIYSLYAHLETMSVSRGQEVRKKEPIGVSGNTGTTWYYKKMKRGYHLHFELIDAQGALDFSNGWPEDLQIGDRKDPMRYLAQKRTFEYGPTPEQLSIIRDSVDPCPVVDFERKIFRVDWYVGGIYKGTTDAKNKEIDLTLDSGEIEEILSRTPVASGNEGQIYELKI